MALPTPKPLDRVYVSAHMTDLSTASSAFVVSPVRGYIKKAWSVIYNSISGADSVWTMKINGTAITGVSVTVANAGSAGGDMDTGAPTSLTTSFVNENDRIEFVSDGASSTTCATTFTAEIEVV